MRVLNEYVSVLLIIVATICLVYGILHSAAVVHCFAKVHEDGICGMGKSYFDLSFTVIGIGLIAPALILRRPGLAPIVGYLILTLLLFSLWVISKYGESF